LNRRSEKHAATTVNYKVDVSKNTAAKEGLKITVVPTVIIYKDGKEVKRVESVNAEKAEEIGAFLDS
jgi:thioredoxin 1